MYIYKSEAFNHLQNMTERLPNDSVAIKGDKKEYGDCLINKVKHCILDWSNLYVCGGAALNYAKGYKTNDVDFYLVGLKTVEEYKKRVDEVLSYFTTITHITAYAASGFINDVKVQLILTNDNTIYDILDTYDIPCCEIAFHVENGIDILQCTRRFIHCITHKTIMFEECKISASYKTRLAKYMSKGFSVAFGFDHYQNMTSYDITKKRGIWTLINRNFKKEISSEYSNYEEDNKKKFIQTVELSEINYEICFQMKNLILCYKSARYNKSAEEWRVYLKPVKWCVEFESLLDALNEKLVIKVSPIELP